MVEAGRGSPKRVFLDHRTGRSVGPAETGW